MRKTASRRTCSRAPLARTWSAGFGPRSLILAYNPGVAATYPAGVGSSSTIVAIVDAFGYTNAERDLNVYRSTFHLGPCARPALRCKYNW